MSDGNFSISCTFFTTSNNQRSSCDDSFQKSITIDGFTYIPFIASDPISQININNSIGFLITSKSANNSKPNVSSIRPTMFLFDPGYNPLSSKYPNEFPYNEPFVQSISNMNDYYITPNNKIRNMQNLNGFNQYIGLRSTYNQIPYIEGFMDSFTNNSANYYATILISPQTTIVEEETEQSWCCCFGLREKTEENLAQFIENPLSYTELNEGSIQERLRNLEKLSLEQRIKLLETNSLLFKDNIVNTKLLDSIKQKSDNSYYEYYNRELPKLPVSTQII
ncbi:17606_t:CDS:2 [Dentiscutata erythropus]|uniref:17606_t:CDS:1 n=1 Tax=Dentiscutata erythropus TaxID=1348616 RepID=A0A9N9GCM4_9GLOM|nr:17606_t:CDS:2 [Dentiscutata erythropus]